MKKKALIFIEDGSFTYDNRVLREANALVDAGWNITVISPKYHEDPFYKKINENLRAYYYPKPTTESIIGYLIECLISLFFGSLLTLWVHIRHGFSIIHACNPMDILWILALPYKVIGKKFIFDQHDLSPELYLSHGSGDKGSLLYKMLILFEKCSYRFADVVFVTNESYKEIAITRGEKNPEDVFVVRNGPDLNKFRIVPPRKGLKKKDDILVGYLGNMNPHDGVEYLLKAAADIVNRRSLTNIRFVFIGGGSSQPRLLEQSRKMNLENNVTFTGRMFGDDMVSTLSACDICVQPDPLNPYNNKSTMNKVLEYMALEKPVIAFDLKETRISCSDAAIYVTPNDIFELEEKILFLADNPEVRAKLGKLGRERIEKELSWDYSIPNLYASYNYVMRLRKKR